MFGVKILGDIMGELNGSTNLAAAQGRAANAQLAQQKEDRALATKAADSADEIRQLSEAVRTNNYDISRQQRILDSTDPAVIEAGKQALEMMKGVESKTLAPLRAQREKEKMKLVEKLQRQLGPGFENTTAGIQALTAFDEATATGLQTAQQNAIGQYLGVSQGFSAQGLTNQVAQQATLGGMYGNIAQRKIGAINGTPINAGLQYSGDIAKYQAQGQNFGQIMQLGGMAVGAMAGGPAGAAAGGQMGAAMGGGQSVNGVAPAGGFTLGNGNYSFK